MSIKQWSLTLLVFVVGAAGGYYLRMATEPAQEEFAALAPVTSEQVEASLTARLEELQQQLEGMRGEVESDEVVVPAAEDIVVPEGLPSIEELQAQAEALPDPATLGRPEVMTESARRSDTTPSGVPRQVLDKYANETGVSPDEIEELMSRQH